MKLNKHTDAVVVIDPSNEMHIFGSAVGRYPFASLTKILTTYVIAEAQMSGFLDLDEQLGATGITFTDLLSHSSGMRANGESPLEPRTRRIYTNEAYERVEQELQFQLGPDFAGETIDSIFSEGIKQQLDCTIEIGSNPAASATGTFEDIIALLREMREPKIIDLELHEKLVTPYLPNLPGIVPGWGHFNHNTWGIGYEIHGDKNDHWMGKKLSPKSFGHFGMAGAFVVHDPVKNISIGSVSNQDFGPWAKDVWPKLNNKIVEQYS